MVQSKVICIGEALIDRIINKSNNNYINYLGGAPANVACGLGKYNIDTIFIGCLGNDEFGKIFGIKFKELKINIDFLQIEQRFPTRIVKVEISREGDRCFVGFQGENNISFADEMMDASKFRSNMKYLEKIYQQTKYIVTGTLFLATSKTSEAVRFLLDYAIAFDIKIVIDVNWRDIFWDNSAIMRNKSREEQKNIIKNFLINADILKLAKEEAFLFFETNDPIQISNSLPKKPDVIITDGSNPIIWFVGGFSGKSNVTDSCEIVDTTGAGDAFVAGLISQWVKFPEKNNKDYVVESINYASASGLLNCMHKGAIDNLPNDNQVKAFLKSKGL